MHVLWVTEGIRPNVKSLSTLMADACTKQNCAAFSRQGTPQVQPQEKGDYLLDPELFQCLNDCRCFCLCRPQFRPISATLWFWSMQNGWWCDSLKSPRCPLTASSEQSFHSLNKLLRSTYTFLLWWRGARVQLNKFSFVMCFCCTDIWAFMSFCYVNAHTVCGSFSSRNYDFGALRFTTLPSGVMPSKHIAETKKWEAKQHNDELL